MSGEAPAPTLEDLRNVPEAAWLWDGARSRIVWANGAGIAHFGGRTLFDLIDRPFDQAEPGVGRIAHLNRSLARGQVSNEQLCFPSSGSAAAMACRCIVHSLPDGRPGILVVAESAAPSPRNHIDAAILSAFDLLPTAAALTRRDGVILHLNAAALLMLGASQRTTLGNLLGDGPASEDLLTRVEAAGLVSHIASVPVRFGRRDIRVTARRVPLAENQEALVLILLDDITERRALETRLSGAESTPARPLPETEAFERLAETLRTETMEADAGPAASEIKPLAARPVLRRRPQQLPVAVQNALDAQGEPVIIAKEGALIHANSAACQFLGFEKAEDLINDTLLWDRFGRLGQSLPLTDIAMEGGRTVQASVKMTVIPWQEGPARQFVLKPAGAPKAANGNLKTVPGKEPRPGKTGQQKEPEAPPSGAGPAAASEADDELRAILDTATDGIITLDANANVHTFSAGAEAIFGYRIADVAGRPFAELLAPESRKVLREYLASLQGPGIAAVFNDGREVMAIVKQGGTVPLFLTIGKLLAAKSQAAFCAVVRDITQWKQTEAELREAKEKAEATNRQKSEFLARISHELRTPLNAIMGFSEVMRLQRFGKIDNDKYRGYVNDIHASGGHLLSLINDLLDLSKVEAGRLELNFTSVNLADVADHAFRMLQEQAIARRVVLRKALPADLPNVVGDLRSMRQIMLNLLSNAVKFTDPGGEIIVSAQMTPGGELKLRVKDTGIGMNAEQLRDALEPFRRVTTEGREAEGTGLGLPLTKALTEANRAEFSIASEPRKGTLVEITFPTTRVLAE